MHQIAANGEDGGDCVEINSWPSELTAQIAIWAHEANFPISAHKHFSLASFSVTLKHNASISKITFTVSSTQLRDAFARKWKGLLGEQAEWHRISVAQAEIENGNFASEPRGARRIFPATAEIRPSEQTASLSFGRKGKKKG